MTIPVHYRKKNRASVHYTRKAGGRLNVSRLLRGKPFFQHKKNTGLGECKYLILNDWRLPFLSKEALQDLKKQLKALLLEANKEGELKVYVSKHGTFIPISEENLENNFPTWLEKKLQYNEELRTNFCQNFLCSADDVLLLDSVEVDSLISGRKIAQQEIDLEPFEGASRWYTSKSLIEYLKANKGLDLKFYCNTLSESLLSLERKLSERGFSQQQIIRRYQKVKSQQVTLQTNDLLALDKSVPLDDLVELKTTSIKIESEEWSFPKLQTLKLEHSHFSTEILEQLLRRARQLRDLRFEFCDNFIGSVQQALALEHLANLEICHSQFGIRVFESIAKEAINLKRLVLVDVRQIGGEFSLPVQLPNLEEFKLDNAGISPSTLLEILSGSSKISKVTIKNYNKKDALRKQCPSQENKHLETLEIENCSFTNKLLSTFLIGSIKLKELTLSHHQMGRDNFLQAFELRHLESFIADGTLLDSEQLFQIIGASQNLKRLNLSGNHKLTELNTELDGFNDLYELNLAGTKVGLANVLSFIENSHNLKALTFTGCNNINDDVVIRQELSIEELDTKRSAITIESLHQLILHCPHLKKITLPNGLLFRGEQIRELHNLETLSDKLESTKNKISEEDKAFKEIDRGLNDSIERLRNGDFSEIGEVSASARKVIAKALNESGELSAGDLLSFFNPFSSPKMRKEKNKSSYAEGVRKKESSDFNLSEEEVVDAGTLHDMEPQEKTQGDVPKPIKKAMNNYFSEEEQSEHSPFILDEIADKTRTNQLVQVSSGEQVLVAMLYLQKLAKEKGRPFFYLDSLEDLQCSGSIIVKGISNIGEIASGKHSRLAKFLKEHKLTNPPPIVCINYNNFSAEEIVQCNQLIDEERLADGIEVPKRALLIGVDNLNSEQCYQGADFTSRFDKLARLSDPLEVIPELIYHEAMDNDESSNRFTLIELFENPDWTSCLLGEWRFTDNQLSFVESEFVRSLKEGQTTFVFDNPPLFDESFTAFMARAKIAGGFDCEGEWVAVPVEFEVRFKRGYDWLSYHNVVELNTTPDFSSIDGNCYALNEETLRTFFVDYRCNNAHKSLTTLPGLLERHQNSPSPLELYLTDFISDSSCAELLSKAKKQNVKLKVSLAPGVSLPPGLSEALGEESYQQESPQGSLQESSQLLESTLQLIVGDDLDFISAKVSESYPEAAVMEVSGQEASTLLATLDANFIEEGKRFEFSESPDLLANLLDDGKTVVLKGDFSQAFINELSPTLLRCLEDKQQSGRLILLSKISEPFSFIPQENKVAYKLTDSELIQQKSSLLLSQLNISEEALSDFTEEELLHRPFCELRARVYMSRQFEDGRTDPWVGVDHLSGLNFDLTSTSLDESTKKAKQFFASRVDEVERMLAVGDYTLQNHLSQSSFIYLTGLTGVGKSAFVKKDWKRKYLNVHYGLDKLEKWARDERAGIKTLFIDEANLEEGTLCCFEGLFSDPPYVLVNKELIPLSPEHKVIFAGNPKTYGDARQTPPFLQKHGNSAHFKPLIPAVLFEEVIKPIISPLIADEALKKEIALVFLTYQSVLNDKAQKIIISPREIGLMSELTVNYLKSNTYENPVEVAQYFANLVAFSAAPRCHHPFLVEKFPSVIELPREAIAEDLGKDFVLTPLRVEAFHTLSDFLELRKQKLCNSRALEGENAEVQHGINALLLEGSPGTGKSKLVQSKLRQLGLVSHLEVEEGSDEFFYHLPASMSFDEKEALLLKAFDEGAVVVIDEVNSTSLMEQLLNSLLSGTKPNGQGPDNPGFLLIATQNPASMAGRKKQSDALMRRFMILDIEDYGFDDMCAILEKKGLPSMVADYAVRHYQARQEHCRTVHLTPPCFRDLINLAENLKKQFFQESRQEHLERYAMAEKKVAELIGQVDSGEEIFYDCREEEPSTEYSDHLVKIRERLSKDVTHFLEESDDFYTDIDTDTDIDDIFYDAQYDHSSESNDFASTSPDLPSQGISDAMQGSIDYFKDKISCDFFNYNSKRNDLISLRTNYQENESDENLKAFLIRVTKRRYLPDKKGATNSFNAFMDTLIESNNETSLVQLTKVKNLLSGIVQHNVTNAISRVEGEIASLQSQLRLAP